MSVRARQEASIILSPDLSVTVLVTSGITGEHPRPCIMRVLWLQEIHVDPSFIKPGEIVRGSEINGGFEHLCLGHDWDDPASQQQEYIDQQGRT